MRTDGSMLTKLSDDGCAFLSSEGEWLYYHNASEGGCLYKMKTDGSEQVKLVDRTVMNVCVADGWVYYSEKSENSSLYRVSVDGGAPQVVIDSGEQTYTIGDKTVNMTAEFVQTYCIVGDWVYFMDANRPYSVRRVHADGSGYELVRPFDFNITTFNLSGGRLFCSFYTTYEEDNFTIGREIVAVDAQTLEKLWQTDADTEPICTGPDGWIYYLKYADGLSWYAMSPDGIEHKIG